MHKGGYEAIFNTDPGSLVNTHFIQYSWVGHGVRLDSQLIAVTIKGQSLTLSARHKPQF